jgi:hypothetical protein
LLSGTRVEASESEVEKSVLTTSGPDLATLKLPITHFRRRHQHSVSMG